MGSYLVSLTCLLVARNSPDPIAADARQVLVRLCTRKPEKWFRLKDLDGYRKRFGDRIPDIMNELCRDLVKPIMEGPEPEPEAEVIDLTGDDEQDGADNSDTPASQAVPTPAPPPALQVPPIQDQTTRDASTDAVSAAPVKTETVEVQVKTEDIPLSLGMASFELGAADQGNTDSPIPSIPSSLCSETAPKVEEHSQPGPSCLPPQPWEYVIVARDEEHASIEDLLNCLVVEELQSLIKLLKVKCASKKVVHLQQ